MMFDLSEDEPTKNKYSSGIEVPIYEPKGKPPHVFSLVDRTKTAKLTREINEANLPEEISSFLIAGAQRHLVFNYETIANYYAHATAEVQQLMEDSALVVVDFNSAIEYGYVKMCQEIKTHYVKMEGELDAEE